MNNIYTCRLMQTAQNHTMQALETADCNAKETTDLATQYEEFRTLLSDFLYDSDTFFAIDTVLKDVLFVLSNASKGKKKY